MRVVAAPAPCRVVGAAHACNPTGDGRKDGVMLFFHDRVFLAVANAMVAALVAAAKRDAELKKQILANMHAKQAADFQRAMKDAT